FPAINHSQINRLSNPFYQLTNIPFNKLTKKCKTNPILCVFGPKTEICPKNKPNSNPTCPGEARVFSGRRRIPSPMITRSYKSLITFHVPRTTFRNKPKTKPNLGRLGKIGKQTIEVVQWEAELDDRNRGQSTAYSL
ncbi:MAG: hypothetical protein WC962_07675, partial [Phycisphaerae bacterium]